MSVLGAKQGCIAAVSRSRKAPKRRSAQVPQCPGPARARHGEGDLPKYLVFAFLPRRSTPRRSRTGDKLFADKCGARW